MPRKDNAKTQKQKTAEKKAKEQSKANKYNDRNKTKTNIYSTDAFYQEQVKAILEAMPKDDDGKEKEVKQIMLNTKTPHPLQTIADIDDYLSKLRTQLIKAIDNGDSVMVIK